MRSKVLKTRVKGKSEDTRPQVRRVAEHIVLWLEDSTFIFVSFGKQSCGMIGAQESDITDYVN